MGNIGLIGKGVRERSSVSLDRLPIDLLPSYLGLITVPVLFAFRVTKQCALFALRF